MQDDWLRDPIWQFIGIIASTVLGIAALIVTAPTVASVVVLVLLCAMAILIVYRIVRKKFAAHHLLENHEKDENEDISVMHYRMRHKLSLQRRRHKNLDVIHVWVVPNGKNSLKKLMLQTLNSWWFIIFTVIVLFLLSGWLLAPLFASPKPLDSSHWSTQFFEITTPTSQLTPTRTP